MKTLTITLALVASALAIPTPTWDIPSTDHATEMQISWTGPVIPDGPEITINGTLSYILNEIQTLNPNYDFAAAAAAKNARRATKTIGKRETGTPNCSPLDRIDFRRCDTLMTGLRAIGGSKCPAPAKQSIVLSNNGCQFFLFSNFDFEFSPYCNDLANDMEILNRECKKMPGAGALWFENHVTAFRGEPR